jgi:hypothetical protein
VKRWVGAGLAVTAINGALAAYHAHRYRRVLRKGVERCRASGQDPERFLLAVIADIQAAQRGPVRGPYHRLEVLYVQRELSRVAG